METGQMYRFKTLVSLRIHSLRNTNHQLKVLLMDKNCKEFKATKIVNS